jgi:hypothetical protein
VARAGVVNALIALVATPPRAAAVQWAAGPGPGAAQLLGTLAVRSSTAWDTRQGILNRNLAPMPSSAPAAALAAVGGIERLVSALAAEQPGSRPSLALVCALQGLVMADMGACEAAAGVGLARWAVAVLVPGRVAPPATVAFGIWSLLVSLAGFPAGAADAAAHPRAGEAFAAALRPGGDADAGTPITHSLQFHAARALVTVCVCLQAVAANEERGGGGSSGSNSDDDSSGGGGGGDGGARSLLGSFCSRLLAAGVAPSLLVRRAAAAGAPDAAAT